MCLCRLGCLHPGLSVPTVVTRADYRYLTSTYERDDSVWCSLTAFHLFLESAVCFALKDPFFNIPLTRVSGLGPKMCGLKKSVHACSAHWNTYFSKRLVRCLLTIEPPPPSLLHVRVDVTRPSPFGVLLSNSVLQTWYIKLCRTILRHGFSMDRYLLSLKSLSSEELFKI